MTILGYVFVAVLPLMYRSTEGKPKPKQNPRRQAKTKTKSKNQIPECIYACEIPTMTLLLNNDNKTSTISII